MKIGKIRIAGFKSFADPVEFEIADGITGIVGPNGCGKSNVVESLRWVMGETSAKRMRGGGMDDVIFNGTEFRPPKNHCEVTMHLENPGRMGPAELKDERSLAIGRRIDRGDGSTYKANGKAVRAKDVQTLFKDAGMGAGSSALVSQGRITAIMNSKPIERRNILEEAAGTAGLSSRRHEAELRLRGTEENLEKAEAVEKALTDQVASLRRQARQARRKREIDAMVRSAEAAVLLHRRLGAELRASTAAAAHERNEESLKALMIEQAVLARALSEREHEAEPLLRRKIDAETAFALARARAENIRKEIASAHSALSNAQKSAVRAAADIDKAKQELAELAEQTDFARDELLAIEDDAAHDPELIEELSIKLEDARAKLDEAVGVSDAAADRHAALAAARENLATRVGDFEARLAKSRARSAEALTKLELARSELAALPPDADLDAAEASEAALTDAHAKAVDLRDAKAIELSHARAAHATISSLLDALERERAGLSRNETAETASDTSSADDGYDEALAAALGSGAHAPLGSGEIHWWSIPTAGKVSHPGGSSPLSAHVTVPENLRAAVEATGVVDDEDHAAAVAECLLPGQQVVTRAGRAYRWDGYVASADATAAEQTRRRRRLTEIESAMESGRSELAAVPLAVAEQEHAAAVKAEADARSEREAASKALEKARRDSQAAGALRIELSGRIAAMNQSVLDMAMQIADDETALSAVRTDLASHASLTDSEASLRKARADQATTARAYDTAKGNLDQATREAAGRAAKREAGRRQIADLQRRAEAAKSTVSENETRRSEALAEIETLSSDPALLPDAEDEARLAVVEAAEALALTQEDARDFEERLQAARTAARDGEAAIAAIRETRAAVLAEIKSAKDAIADLAREIEEKLHVAPGGLELLAGVSVDEALPDLETCEARLERLRRERDTIGTVNLLAEQQLGEAEEKAGAAEKMRAELREAVRQLRDTICKLNTECKERIIEAFGVMDANFQSLFRRVFGGGEAYLKLSGSDDPLEAGLEVFASPPGKKLQTMSLLSGGEQSLISLALIFAAFLIRPAPVCVLDEVDAALDDANTDRMCRLVAELAAEGTRFLVITHHALTMARCDRLIGVTMAERGVSKLVTMDLDKASSHVQSSSMKD